MIIYPAIDLRHGRCVRLRQGDPDAETVFGENPAQMAQHWVNQGAEWLHVVNLDGALGATQSQITALHKPTPRIVVQPIGQDVEEDILSAPIEQLPINLQRLYEIRQAVKIPIQFGGGLRTIDDIRLAITLGADRVVLGTVAIKDTAIVREALDIWGEERIVVGIDARNGKVAIDGWQKTSAVDAVDLGHDMYAMGVRRVVYTDISRDGMLSGVNVEATARLGDTTDLQVIASGGVANLQDIERLKAHEHYNIEGAITGQAIYTGSLELAPAIELGYRPLIRRSAGIVPFRRGVNGPEFLLLFNLFLEQWQFPRGIVQSNESDQACAQREFQEETGLSIGNLYEDCQITLNYTSTIRAHEIERTIVYYLAEAGEGKIQLGHENLCEYRWYSAKEAWEILTETAPEQLPALDSAVNYLEKEA